MGENRLTGLRERLWDFGLRWALLSRPIGYKVHRIDRRRVLKWIDTPTEASSMAFVARNTTIPIPRVYEIVRHEGRYALIMEYIDASERAWGKLTADAKASVAKQLGEYISQLRDLIPPHPGIVECIDGCACRDPKLNMPLEVGTVEYFHESLGHDLVRDSTHADWAPYRPKFEQIRGRKYKTMFCHADLSWHNILIRDGRIVAILDWESAGWYPEYWEYTRLSLCWVMDPKFWELLQPHLTVYPDELAADLALSDAITGYW
ncbi:kinase-like protein [Exidia glandulosa HHB12029]|uniref:Kinase-like protein n=1 Tax=Exidia glandulosa HHB12029 TaxID=1314781 RepID=A0A165CU42_EXIGL|nr:kinase-like protein [Exidia glandulosa HHB12029]